LGPCGSLEQWLVVCSSYSSAQQPQSQMPNAVPVNEAQPQFALYRPDVVHSTGSPHHAYHPQPASAAAASAADAAASNVVNMPPMQTFNNVPVPAQNLLWGLLWSRNCWQLGTGLQVASQSTVVVDNVMHLFYVVFGIFVEHIWILVTLYDCSVFFVS